MRLREQDHWEFGRAVGKREERELVDRELGAILDEFAPDETKPLAQRIRDEMHDYMMVIDHCRQAYLYLTDGAVGKVNTLWSAVEPLADDIRTRDVRRAEEEERERAITIIQQRIDRELKVERGVASAAVIACLDGIISDLKKRDLSALKEPTP